MKDSPRTSPSQAVRRQVSALLSLALTLITPDPPPWALAILVFCTVAMQGYATREWFRLIRQHREDVKESPRATSG